METWLQLIDPPKSPAYNMACDEWLLRHIGRLNAPVFRLYGWDQPSLSIGYFQTHVGKDPAKFIVRRPTGGGAVDHTQDNTYSVVLPRAHPWCAACSCDRYKLVHQIVRNLLLQRSYKTEFAQSQEAAGARRDAECFSMPTRFDVLLDGRKVAGGAQRLTREGLLHQGSVLLVEKSGKVKPWGIGEWNKALFMAGIRIEPLKFSREIKREIESLAADKYEQAHWNLRR